MGNSLVSFHPIGSITGPDKVVVHDNRRSRKPSPHEFDRLRPGREFLNNWKNSKSEIIFYSYRIVIGAIVGMIGGVFFFPLMKHSPYLYRKLTMSLRETDLFPTDNMRLILRTISPYYMAVGAGIAFGTSFLSELYDRIICSNKFTKFGMLGAIEGGLIFAIVGGYGTWTNGIIGGGILGIVSCALKTNPPTASFGDYGKAAEYMDHISEEDKKKFELQEARIMGLRPK